jgi:rod shape determining protein RodA
MGHKLWPKYDLLLLMMYVIIVVFGWLNIYTVSYDGKTIAASLLDFSSSAGKQFIWIGSLSIVFIISLFLDTKFYLSLAYFFYVLSMFVLAGTLVWGVKVGGHSSWFQFGSIQLQPTEFVKLTCALAVGKLLGSNIKYRITSPSIRAHILLLIFLPTLFIVLQGDVGSALVFSSFWIVLYREGWSRAIFLLGFWVMGIFILSLLFSTTYVIIGTISIGIILIGINRSSLKKVLLVFGMILITICFVEVVESVLCHVLKPHQQNRIKVLLNPASDPLGIGWNVMQAKIAIGAGGVWGKGFLQGTQTKYGFVPEQRKDFIFCTIGEEYGWIGSCLFIMFFMGFIFRILHIAERQRLRFGRAYGYGVASILFFHFFVNIGMTIGIVPVIGIPLPFISYGGSSLWAFSLMLFILLKLDSERMQYGSWDQVSVSGDVK